MKNFLMISVMAFSAAAKGEMANFTVKKKLQSDVVALQGLSLEFVDKKEPMGSDGQRDPLGAELQLKLKGKFETGYCYVSELLARTASVDENSNGSDSFSTLEFIGVEKTSGAGKTVQLSESICAGGTAGQFEMPFKLVVNSWSEGQRSQIWTFQIINENPHQAERKIVVVFDVEKGWSFALN